MYKVLIADDEKCMHAYKKLIDWDRLGLEVIGIVHNAIDAYECIQSEKPDIVISDIRMPGYDGLELIKKTRDLGLQVDFIIISGYKYFEYAHKALGMGVEHYLLKPINQCELEESLLKIVSKKNESEENIKAQEHLQEEIYSKQKKMKKHFLTSILMERDTNLELANIQEAYDCNFREQYFQAIFVKIDFPLKESCELSSLLSIVETNIDKILKQFGCEYINSVMKSGVVSVLNFNSEQEQTIMDVYERLLRQIQYELNKFNVFTVTLGVGLKVAEIGEVKKTINSAIGAVKCRIKKGVSRMIDAENLHYTGINISELIDIAEIKKLENIIEALDVMAFHSYCSYIYSEIIKIPFYSPVAIFDVLEKMEEIIVKVLERNQAEAESVAEMQGRLDIVFDINISEEVLVREFEETIKQCIDSIIQNKKNKSQLPVRLAKQYIQKHFAQPLSLESVGEAINLSPAYLSTVFKKEMKINFTDYVISCRIEAAKELLKSTDKSIASVAEEVGYMDSRYFGKIFVKVVGLKPSVYRKLYT